MSELELWNELGNLYFNGGSFDEAMKAYHKAIEINRDFGWPYSNLGLIYCNRGKFTEAILLYRKSIGLLETSQEKAVSWNRLGSAYRGINDITHAVKAYARAVKLDPDNADFNRDLQAACALQASLQSVDLAESPVGAPAETPADESLQVAGTVPEWLQPPARQDARTPEIITEKAGEEQVVPADAVETQPPQESGSAEAELTIDSSLEVTRLSGAVRRSAGKQRRSRKTPPSGEDPDSAPASAALDWPDALLLDEQGSEKTAPDETILQETPDHQVPDIEAPVNSVPADGAEKLAGEPPVEGQQAAVDSALPAISQELPEWIRALILEPDGQLEPAGEIMDAGDADNEMPPFLPSEKPEGEVAGKISRVEEPAPQVPLDEADSQAAGEAAPQLDDEGAVAVQGVAEGSALEASHRGDMVADPGFTADTEDAGDPGPALPDEAAAKTKEEPSAGPDSEQEAYLSAGYTGLSDDQHAVLPDQPTPYELAETQLVKTSRSGKNRGGALPMLPKWLRHTRAKKDGGRRASEAPEGDPLMDSPAVDQQVAENSDQVWLLSEAQAAETQPASQKAPAVQPEPEDIETTIARHLKILEANPANDRSWDALGNLYRASGRYQDAMYAFERAIILSPENEVYQYNLGLVYTIQKCYDEAIGAFQRVLELNPSYVLAHCALAGIYNRLGEKVEADLHTAIARPLMEDEKEYNRACFEAICGNTDQALVWLAQAIEQGQTPLDWILKDPDLDPLRSDPRFDDLIARSRTAGL